MMHCGESGEGKQQDERGRVKRGAAGSGVGGRGRSRGARMPLAPFSCQVLHKGSNSQVSTTAVRAHGVLSTALYGLVCHSKQILKRMDASHLVQLLVRAVPLQVVALRGASGLEGHKQRLSRCNLASWALAAARLEPGISKGWRRDGRGPCWRTDAGRNCGGGVPKLGGELPSRDTQAGWKQSRAPSPRSASRWPS